MSQAVMIELELPENLQWFTLPAGVADRLQNLLGRQDRGEELSSAERLEARGLVDLADLLLLLRLRANRALPGPAE